LIILILPMTGTLVKVLRDFLIMRVYPFTGKIRKILRISIEKCKK